TLYKYYPDVEAILIAWHERQISRHLEQLTRVRDLADRPVERLEAVLTAYALIRHEHHDTQLGALLHRGEHFARAAQQLQDFIQDLLTEATQPGNVRDAVTPDGLASYCLSALTAATSLPSPAAVQRLVQVILTGLRANPPALKAGATPPEHRRAVHER